MVISTNDVQVVAPYSNLLWHKTFMQTALYKYLLRQSEMTGSTHNWQPSTTQTQILNHWANITLYEVNVSNKRMYSNKILLFNCYTPWKQYTAQVCTKSPYSKDIIYLNHKTLCKHIHLWDKPLIINGFYYDLLRV